MKFIRSQMTLKTRITVSFVLLMTVVMLFVGAAVHIAYEWIEEYVFAESMRNETQWLEATLKQGQPLVVPEGRKFYDALTVPDKLRQYPLGFHDVDGLGEEWNLLVFDLNDQRYYFLQDGEYFEYLERIIEGFTLLIMVLCILCAFWIGRLTSARVIAPITRLANAVAHKEKPFPFQAASDEMGVLARAFSQHSNELEQFLQREQCFVGDASHELRTPLAVIAGAAETIVYQLPADSHLAQSGERIVRTTQEMQRQLACLLLLSRDPQTLPKTDTSLLPLLEECLARCQPYLARKPVELVLDAPQDIHVHTHAELARSVVWNLLRNACQYTDQGEVRIALHSMTLVIADTGPGLPPSIDPQQFQRFQAGTRSSGEGLGLSIVQRIVEHLGWRMEVESSDQGCRFTLHMHRAA